ncbi:hypothetical protein [Sorangium sp. So ce385]|uniref:hypothetical protein n=1 Tax=Sorangium sp. So ce385 TaxID=3133308 RepID=UPI003F5C3A24
MIPLSCRGERPRGVTAEQQACVSPRAQAISSTLAATTSPYDPTGTAADEAPGAADDLAPGTLAGEFLVEEARSHGGFAVVYLATQLGTGRPAALEVLRPRLAASTPRAARCNLARRRPPGQRPLLLGAAHGSPDVTQGLPRTFAARSAAGGQA